MKRSRISFDVLCERQSQVLYDPNPETFKAAARASDEWHHYASIEEYFFSKSLASRGYV